MDRRIFIFLAVSAHLCSIAAGEGPANNFLTQTVYGFLDFTTTIGNTVMVFSPQSAPPPEPPQTEKSVQENIIETKPPPINNVKPEAIKPTKTSDKDKTNKAPVVASSAISVVTSPPKKDDKVISISKSVPKEQKQIITKVEVVAGPSKIVENSPKQPAVKPNKPSSQAKKQQKNQAIKSVTNIVSSKVEVKQNPAPSSIINTKISSAIQIKSSQVEEEPAILVSNNIGEPEYDYLSRQPSEFVEETYRVINLRPSKAHAQKPKNNLKNRHQPTPPPEDDEHPIGLVTTLGGTIVKDGLTTVHETSVIGTYISGKYAQVLNSNSKILQSGHKAKISPSSPHRILKTAAPAISKNHRHNLEPTPSVGDGDNNNKTPRRQGNSGSSFKNRHKPQNGDNVESAEPPSQGKKFKNRNSSHAQRTQSESSSPPFSNRRKSNRNSGHKTTVTPSSNSDSQGRRGFKSRIQPTAVEQVTPAPTSVYKFKLNRAPGSGRWQYKTSPKPKVTIRKSNSDDEQQTTPSLNPLFDDSPSNELQARSDNDLEQSGSQSGPGTLVENDTDDTLEKPPPVETLKVEISTPADFRDVYYEIATLKSPYTFQVGRVKNTRIITVTTTIEKRIEPTQMPFNSQNPLNEPLTENILATASPYGKDNYFLDSSIATLPAITLSSDVETPPLETITETFSTTQNMLKTHILPIVREPNITSSLTFIQTYQITRLVTATKTLPPMEFFQFIPSKTLKEFNSRLDEAGSELHLELDFGDSNEDEDGAPRRVFPPDLDLSNIGSNFDLAEIDKYRDNHLRLKKAHGQNKNNQVTEPPNPSTPALSPEQAQQLALLRLLNPAAAAQIPNVVTTSKPILKYETIYESHVIPLFDGKNTIHSTLSRPVATITKTEYEIGTSSLPALPLNPLFQQQQQFTVTSTPVVLNTEVVATDSQIIKLTFGAKTLYTTLFTTKVVPTVLTSYVTSSIPVQPSANFPGYFPAPYPPFPYVG
ncbi:flocculation protein FLO11 isoform X2 [Pararge aegeria]|uniref:Jg11236 protein n=1 Tax=Pararge aegeria aegeria TaxID=348720 RepID=A0A8S4RM86_9NEOP|nr:flocculation protein FLO11 isoform X2 [Pararge aegeria]CAH2237270.1 jg11236 [Pararge aegeria aegeria]